MSGVATTGTVGGFTGATAASVLSVRYVILNGLTGAVFISAKFNIYDTRSKFEVI
jgi:hypothetical protein